MTESELYQRQYFVAEALSWEGTPYHHGQREKGLGVDCAWYLADCAANAGLIPRLEFEYYPRDWHQHRNDERYLRQVEKFARKMPEGADPLPGDIAMHQFGRCVAHGAIVIAWPRIIHAVIGVGVVRGEEFNDKLKDTFRGIYRYKGWA